MRIKERKKNKWRKANLKLFKEKCKAELNDKMNLKDQEKEMTFDDFYRYTKKNSFCTLCSQRERRFHQALQNTRSRWLAQASAEIGPEEPPSASCTWCPGRKSKAAKC